MTYRLPCRDGRSVHAISDTSHNTANNQMWEGKRSALQCGTDDHDNRAGEDGLASAQVVANPDTEDCTTKTAQIVAGNCDSW